jgi:hypothetical protein
MLRLGRRGGWAPESRRARGAGLVVGAGDSRRGVPAVEVAVPPDGGVGGRGRAGRGTVERGAVKGGDLEGFVWGVEMVGICFFLGGGGD